MRPQNVYVVQHSHLLPNGVDDVKLIGAFSSKERARQAIEKLGGKPGFRSSHSGFAVDLYRLNQIHWEEGFSSK